MIEIADWDLSEDGVSSAVWSESTRASPFYYAVNNLKKASGSQTAMTILPVTLCSFRHARRPPRMRWLWGLGMRGALPWTCRLLPSVEPEEAERAVSC